MTAGVVVTGDADTGCALWWFVGVTTAPTKRDAQVGRSVRAGIVGRSPTVGLVGNVVTAHGESWLSATPAGPSLRRGVIGNAGRHEFQTCAVMVVPCPERAEEILLAGDMPCPRCRGVLRPFGNGRTRTVRGVGADTVTVTPRRARCADCRVTQILLPTELLVRRADSTAAIGNALVAKAGGAGFRSIAARFGRPESTVRRWLRAVREPHAQWLYQRGVDSAVLVDVELLDRPAPQRTTLGHGLNLLAGAAVRLRDSFDISDPVWSLIGFFAHGRPLAPPGPLLN